METSAIDHTGTAEPASLWCAGFRISHGWSIQTGKLPNLTNDQAGTVIAASSLGEPAV
jgi:hypothetical protein